MKFNQFARRVLKELGHEDWNWKWHNDIPECVHETKEILMSSTYRNDPDIHNAEKFLHEVAHIKVFNHNSDFYRLLGSYLNQFSVLIEKLQPGFNSTEVEIKFDKNTLPFDGSKVKFQHITTLEWYEGIYLSEDQIFWINSFDWHHVDQVVKWKYKNDQG